MKPERVSITNATPGRTLDVETRQRRYIITMSIRVLCFVVMLFVPGVWRWVALAGAAVLPAIAVLFANASDHRPGPLAGQDTPTALALSGPNTIRGHVDE